MFAFIAVPVFKLLSCIVLFVNKKTIETVKKQATFLGKQQIPRVNYYKIIKVGGQKFHDTSETPKRSFISAFSVCMTVLLRQREPENNLNLQKYLYYGQFQDLLLLHGRFQVVSTTLSLVPGGFSWFQCVSHFSKYFF